MSRAIERIEREIAGLEQTIAELAEEFYNTYSRYLAALGKGIRKQLILATYHLCTQSYPEEFLSLSFNQRQKLQQTIKQLAERTAQELILQVNSPMEVKNRAISINELEINELQELIEESIAEIEKQEINEEKNHIAESELTESKVELTTEKPNTNISNPDALLHWQERLENAIAQILQRLSRDSNLRLQQSGLLPKKLPEPVLEAAAKVEAAAETMPGPPNLLNLVIETESDRESQSSTVTHLVAVHLRLSEIEFPDSTLTSLRQQIRNLSVKLHTTRREYQKKQREKAIAEAELAWRASWFDD
ncbi:hypothetical protein NIES2119_23340 [[Phormidium ambiguum] IAM M-71]|uniref:Primosomal protein n=1 Tax=[Phormidium ambiguum] IAM M-71 TaxID=454136 RepID=A0A1U7I9X0_9CYAN|nr:hypothetical protein [Phormidium ambiguum]OKH33336.1 hypothetical protein NIES2119_23340 [Phormidium ambiguum IAM M-71]